MLSRSLRALFTAIGATLLLTGIVAAGGSATARIDPPPDDPASGEPVPIGFTLLQHGVTPVTVGPTTLDIINVDTGERTTFAAAPSGPSGHWVAEVTFTSGGVYRFEIGHELQIQSINVDETTLNVRNGAAIPAAAAATSTPATAGSMLPWVILAGAALVIAAVLLVVLRPSGRDPSAATTAKARTSGP